MTHDTLHTLSPSSSAPAERIGDHSEASPSSFPFHSLDVYQAARRFAAFVHRVSIGDAELRDQATRAAKSAFLNPSRESDVKGRLHPGPTSPGVGLTVAFSAAANSEPAREFGSIGAGLSAAAPLCSASSKPLGTSSKEECHSSSRASCGHGFGWHFEGA